MPLPSKARDHWENPTLDCCWVNYHGSRNGLKHSFEDWILFPFPYSKDNHSAKMPVAFTHPCRFEGNHSPFTTGLELNSPGHSQRPPGSSHSLQAAKAARDALSPPNSCLRRRYGEEESSQGKGNKMRGSCSLRWSKERERGGKAYPALRPLWASRLSFLYPSLPSVKGRVSSFRLHKVLATKEKCWTWSSVNLAKFQSITDFLMALFIFFPSKSLNQYWLPDASMSLQKVLNLLLEWPSWRENFSR